MNETVKRSVKVSFSQLLQYQKMYCDSSSHGARVANDFTNKNLEKRWWGQWLYWSCYSYFEDMDWGIFHHSKFIQERVELHFIQQVNDTSRQLFSAHSEMVANAKPFNNTTGCLVQGYAKAAARIDWVVDGNGKATCFYWQGGNSPLTSHSPSPECIVLPCVENTHFSANMCLFLRFTTNIEVDLSDEIISMLARDLVMKKMVSSDLCSMAQYQNHEPLLMYLASWSMSPMINTDRIKEIEDLVEQEFSEDNLSCI